MAEDEDFYLYEDQVLKSPDDHGGKKGGVGVSITENGTERATTPTLDDEMDSLLGVASQAPTGKIVSNAPDLQPKAVLAADKTEETASDEVEDEEEEEEESESDDDDVQITINPIQPTSMPYGRSQSYTRMTIPPGGSGALGGAKKVDLDAVPQIGGQSLFEVKLDPDKPWKMPGADVTDYFNYGFTEETWRLYCEKQKRLRGEVASLNKIVVRGGSTDTNNILPVNALPMTPTGSFPPMLGGPPPPPGPMYPPPPPAPSSFQPETPTQLTPVADGTPPRGKTPDVQDQASDGRATPDIEAMESTSSAGKAPLLPPPASGPSVLPSLPPPPPPFGLPGVPPPGFPGMRGQDNVAAAMAAMFGVRPPDVLPPPMHPGMPPFPPHGFPGGIPGPDLPPFHGLPPHFHMHGDRGPGPMDMVPHDLMPPGMPGQFPWDPTLGGPPPPEMMEGFQMRPERRSGSRSASSSASRSRSRSRSSSYEDHGRNRRRRHRRERERRSKSRSHSRDRHRSSRYHRSDHHRSDRHRERDREREREKERERERERDRDREKRRRDRKEKEERSSRHERSSRRHRSTSRDREEERSSRKEKSKSSADKEQNRDSRSRSQTPTS